MSASRPGQGTVVASGASAAQKATSRALDGSWRPDLPFNGHDGLKVTLRAANGITDPKVLKVPMRFQAPVTDDFRRAFSHPWSRYDTLRLGQRSRPMGPELLELPISTLLLDGPAQDATSGVVVWPHSPEPQKVIAELRHLAGVGPAGRRGKATAFRLTISQPVVWGDDPLINILAVLTRVEPTQKAGQVGTEYLDLSFLEFVEDEVSRRQQPSESEKTRTHTLKAGDTLYKLATRYYHQPSTWRAIASANGIKGVSANDAGELAAWAKRHSKKTLKIPAATPAVKGLGTGGVALT